MKRETDFLMNADRYQFDSGECSTANGYAQVDTKQDAWYYGTWANPETFTIVSYAEGDVTRQTADDADEFVTAIRELKAWNEKLGYWIGIDPMLNTEIDRRFRDLGLGDLLH